MNLKQKLKEIIEDSPLFYFKITREEKWANDIIQGKLFMNTINFYKKLEKEEGLKGQGDKDELTIKLNPIDATIIAKDRKDGSELARIPVGMKNLNIEFDNDKKKPVFCIIAITLDDMEIVEDDGNLIRLKLNFSEKEIDRLKSEFGQYVVFIKAFRFQEKLEKSLNSLGINWTLDKVNYTNENMNKRLELTKNNDLKRFLYKDPDFKYQKEYRLILDEDVEDNKILEIEKISKDDGFLINIDSLLNFGLVYNIDWLNGY